MPSLPLSRRTLLASIAALAVPVRLRAQDVAAPGEPVQGGTLIYLDQQPHTQLYPPAGGFYPNGGVLNQITDKLTWQNPETLEVEPWIAESWEVSPDLTEYTFRIRPGVTFSDGTPLDAAAVKANLDRYLDPATASIRKADFGPLAEVAVTGPLTVELRMSAPYAPLPLVLTNRAGMVVSMTALRRLGPDFATQAVGCGPFKFASWTKNSELVLERFDGYWRGRDGGFDRLVFITGSFSLNCINMFLGGNNKKTTC